MFPKHFLTPCSKDWQFILSRLPIIAEESIERPAMAPRKCFQLAPGFLWVSHELFPCPSQADTYQM
jgi:hypothetical protein